MNLAAALAMRGRKTLLIDLDPQANSSISFLDLASIQRSTFDAIGDPSVGLADIIQPAPLEHLFIAPARIALAKLESRLVGELDAHFRLKDNTFFAIIHLTVKGERVAVDARPSDAIALALRARAPILVEETVIDNAKTVDFASERADSDRLQKWLESLDPDELGKYKM